MDLKRWLMALAVAALLMAPIGSSTTAHAAVRDTVRAGLAYHDQPSDDDEGEGEGEGEEGESDEGNGGLPGLVTALLKALGGDGD